MSNGRGRRINFNCVASFKEKPPALDLGVFLRRCVDDSAANFSDEEYASLDGQVRALAQTDETASQLPPDPTAPTIVRGRKHMKQVASLLIDASDVAIDLETNSLDPRGGEIVGVGLAAGDANYYVPVAHRFENEKMRPDQLPVDVVARELRIDRLPLIAHNAKFEFRWLRRHAAITCHFVWDTMLAARLMASHISADLKTLASREMDVLDWSLPKEEIEAIQFMTIERAARYCAKDCRHTLELSRRQRQCLR